MGVVTCVYCGKNNKDSTNTIFHKFPTGKKELCRRWEIATRLINFKATGNLVLCSDHFCRPADYKFHDSKILNDDAVPSIFLFPGTSKAAFQGTDAKIGNGLQRTWENFYINLTKGKPNTLSTNFHFKTRENFAKNGNTEHLYQYDHGNNKFYEKTNVSDFGNFRQLCCQ